MKPPGSLGHGAGRGAARRLDARRGRRVHAELVAARGRDLPVDGPVPAHGLRDAGGDRARGPGAHGRAVGDARELDLHGGRLAPAEHVGELGGPPGAEEHGVGLDLRVDPGRGRSDGARHDRQRPFGRTRAGAVGAGERHRAGDRGARHARDQRVALQRARGDGGVVGLPVRAEEHDFRDAPEIRAADAHEPAGLRRRGHARDARRGLAVEVRADGTAGALGAVLGAGASAGRARAGRGGGRAAGLRAGGDRGRQRARGQHASHVCSCPAAPGDRASRHVLLPSACGVS